MSGAGAGVGAGSKESKTREEPEGPSGMAAGDASDLEAVKMQGGDVSSEPIPGSEGLVIKWVDGKAMVRVFILNNKFHTLLVHKETTVQEFLAQMAYFLEMKEPDEHGPLFSLHESKDGRKISRPLARNLLVLDLIRTWVTPAHKFVYTCKCYTESLMETEDPVIVNLLYAQAVYYVMNHTWPITEEEALALAGRMTVMRFGRHNRKKHRPGLISHVITTFIPEALIALAAELDTVDWERKIFVAHAKHKDNVSTRVNQSKWLAMLRASSVGPYYGATLFPVMQSFNDLMPRRIVLGIYRDGILLLRRPNMTSRFTMDILAKHPLSELLRWAHKKEAFYFEYKPESGEEPSDVLMFDTTEGAIISELLTDYAALRLREIGFNMDGSRVTKPESPAEASRRRREERVAHRLAGRGVGAAGSYSYGDNVGGTDEAYYGDGSYNALSYYEGTDAAYDTTADAHGGLPDGWHVAWDEASGANYYQNAATGETSWERPA